MEGGVRLNGEGVRENRGRSEAEWRRRSEAE